MNVVLALFRYFPHGGMQRDLLATAHRCREAGHAVRIYCHTWKGPRPDGTTVEVLPAHGVANHVRARRFAADLQQRLRDEPADVVVGFDKLPGLDLYFAADPCFVARTRHRGFVYRLTQRYRTFRALEGDVFGDASRTRILLLDERQQGSYRSVWQTADDRFVLLPPGVDRSRRKGPDAERLRREARAGFALAEHDRLCLLLAANFELKGLDRAITALAHLPQSIGRRTLLLAVGQAEASAMWQLATQLGVADRVRMLPGRDDVPALLQAADLLVHPARHDTTGTVLLEALVAGLPVLCTDACGYARYIEAAGAGRVLPEPFDQERLNQALAELLIGSSDSLRGKALAYAENHDLHGMHDRILAEIERTVSDRASPPSARPGSGTS